jgi:hypothetical protein
MAAPAVSANTQPVVVFREPPPPPLPAPDPTARRHDGFYLRLGLGAGFVRSEVDVDTMSVSDEVQIRGAGAALEIALGGTIAPGLVIGGGIYGVSISPVTWETDGAAPFSSDSTVEGGQGALTVLGVMLEYYPNPRGGFHVQGALGIGTLELKPDSKRDYPGENWEGGGGGLMLGAGYEFWIADQWSLGGVARVLMMSGKVRGSESELDYDSRAIAPALLFVATHH